MRLAVVDEIAITGHGWLHQRSTPAKVIMSLAILIGIMGSRAIWQLLTWLLLLLILAGISHLPVSQLLVISLYPSIFSLPFALGRLSVSLAAAVSIPLRAVASALVLLMLIATTPYPKMLNLLSRFCPPLLVDGLFMTYRTFFIIMSNVEQLFLNMRLRGALTWRNPGWSFVAAANGLALTFVQTIAMSERLYQTYSLRGYQGHLILSGYDDRVRANEAVLIGLLALAVVGVIWLG